MSPLQFCKRCQRYTTVDDDRLCKRCVKRIERKQESIPIRIIRALIRKTSFGADKPLGWRGKVYQPQDEDQSMTYEEWRILRTAIFERDKYRCKRCDKRFKTNSLSAHHIMPRSAGGSNDMSNLTTLCNPCHDFVEINNLRTLAEIAGSYEAPEKVKPTDTEAHEPKELKDRPDWHKWVYGGSRRPGHSSRYH